MNKLMHKSLIELVANEIFEIIKSRGQKSIDLLLPLIEAVATPEQYILIKTSFMTTSEDLVKMPFTKLPIDVQTKHRRTATELLEKIEQSGYTFMATQR